MRSFLFTLCFLLFGCGAHPTTEKEASTEKTWRYEIIDSSGTNLLVLVDASAGSITDKIAAANFHSLVWRTKSGADWHDRLVISEAAFQGDSPRRHFVSQIHSLDAAKGTAIIMVAEADAPEGSPYINIDYSWREWNLLTNGEVRFIRSCRNPFEKY